MSHPITNNALTQSSQDALNNALEYNRYTYGEGVEPRLHFDPIHRYDGSDGSYLDYINDLKAQTNTLDMAGTVINGQGIGWDGNNLTSNFDIRNTLAGRALTATGVINDTPLGMIGNTALRDILINRTLYNTQRETVGRINLDPVNMVRGGDIVRPDYSITIGYDALGKAAKVFSDITGIQTPLRLLNDDSSILEAGNSQNRIKNTGKGQVRALFENLNLNKYAPNYSDKRVKKISLEDKSTYGDKRKDFKGLLDNEVHYDDILNPGVDSLLSKTQSLFNHHNELNGEYIVYRREHYLMHDEKSVEVQPSETMNTVQIGGQHHLSKGSGVRNRANEFVRVFTKKNKYNKVGDLHKKRGLIYENSANNSVLDSNGFVRVSPYQSDNIQGTGFKSGSNMKRFMLSLENLAWDGYTNNLPTSEVGPGDKINDVKGRIMWFPPYDITFNDSTSVNIESTNFIGRGEPIYTYNNTERTGNLQFKIIIDYPSYMEDFKGETDEFFQRIATGVEDVSFTTNMSVDDRDTVEVANAKTDQEIMDIPQTPLDTFRVYFPYQNIAYDPAYEINGLNSTVTEEFIDALANQIETQCPACRITLTPTISGGENEDMGNGRVESIKVMLESAGVKQPITVERGLLGTILGEPFDPIDADINKRARIVAVSFEYDPLLNEENIKQVKPTEATPNRNLNQAIKKRFMNESMYFKKLQDDSPIAYEELNKAISQKIQFFHPGFHSMTPEGFNSRLTFLQQCTRQGPTQNENRADNLAFGKPPVCILRIGDFYHTKIMIDNLNFSYDPLVWDLNPEGIGVQPMICTVDISFKFLGGSSLEGPINKLQNAVSFNFFANTEVYDPRADKIVNGKYENGDAIRPDNPTPAEVKKNKVDPPVVKVDEAARVEKTLTTQSTDPSQQLMSNLDIVINNANKDEGVRFVITPKDGFDTTNFKPTKLKAEIQLVSRYDNENDGTVVAYQVLPVGTFEITSEVFGNGSSIKLNPNQVPGFTEATKLILTLKKDNLPLRAEYTI